MFEKDFSRFWERKLPRMLSSLPMWDDATHRDVSERASRRRLAAFVRALYSDPDVELFVSVGDMVEVVAATADTVRVAGRQPDRLTAVVPVATHRAWCAGLVADTDAGGWPRLAGVEVIADLFAEPRSDWEPGMPAVESGGDRVTIINRRTGRLLVDQCLVTGFTTEANVIYSQLRADGWSVARGVVAAKLLASAETN